MIDNQGAQPKHIISKPKPSPIFLVGFPRSGTTLLQSLLNAHPDITILFEEDLHLRLYPRYGKMKHFSKEQIETFILDLYKSKTFRLWNIDPDVIRAALLEANVKCFSDVIATVYITYAKLLKADKLRWGVKVPYYLNHLQFLRNIVPGCKFIHIIRDGRDVLLSMRERVRRKTGHFETRTALSALQWKTQILRGYETGQQIGGKQYYEIKYEDLVRDPVQLLPKIFTFLGVRQTNMDLLLKRYFEQATQGVLDSKKANNYLISNITTTRIAKWQTEMPVKDRQVYEAIAGDSLRKAGYISSGEGLPLKAHIKGKVYSAVYGAYSKLPVLFKRVGRLLFVN